MEQKSSRKRKDIADLRAEVCLYQMLRTLTTILLTHSDLTSLISTSDRAKSKRTINDMVNMGVEPRTLALLAPRSKPTELIDRY